MFRIIFFSSKAIPRNLLRNAYNFSTTSKQVKRQIIEPIKTKFQIKAKQKINHDCYIYKFKFNGPKFSLKIGHHFRFITKIPTVQQPEGQQIMKYYTPITSSKDFQNDKIDVLIKIYRPNQNPFYPAGGKLTPFLQKLNVGDKIDVQGPFGKFTYQSPGQIQISKNLFSKTKTIYNVKKIFFIAGGTGITPIYQTITQIVKAAQDKTQITLLFCNKTQNDILLRKQLESLQHRLKVYHMLQNPPQGWNGLTGRINEEILNKICQLNDEDTFTLYCGPKPMNIAINKIFQEKYPNSHHFKI